MKLERGVFPTAWTGSNNDTKGYSGSKPYFRKFSEIKGKKIKVYQGVGDEEWYTIVYDDEGNTGWYTPKYTHITTKDEVLTDAAKWLMSSMNFVATSVFFAQMAYIENLGVRNVLLSDGSTIEGGMCHSNVNESGGELGLGDVRFWLGDANPSLGKIRGYKNGKFVAADGKAVFDEDGNVTLCGGNAMFDKDGNTTIKKLTATEGSFEGEINASMYRENFVTYRMEGNTDFLIGNGENPYAAIIELCRLSNSYTGRFRLPTPSKNNNGVRVRFVAYLNIKGHGGVADLDTPKPILVVPKYQLLHGDFCSYAVLTFLNGIKSEDGGAILELISTGQEWRVIEMSHIDAVLY